MTDVRIAEVGPRDRLRNELSVFRRIARVSHKFTCVCLDCSSIACETLG
jgi:hypothetical protein